MERTVESRGTPLVSTAGRITPVARASAVRLRSRWINAEAGYLRPVRVEVESDGSMQVYRIPDIMMQVRLAMVVSIVVLALLRRLKTW